MKTSKQANTIINDIYIITCIHQTWQSNQQSQNHQHMQHDSHDMLHENYILKTCIKQLINWCKSTWMQLANMIRINMKLNMVYTTWNHENHEINQNKHHPYNHMLIKHHKQTIHHMEWNKSIHNSIRNQTAYSGSKILIGHGMITIII